jgi:glycosyltransferase involved in cell wall biosynthesis
VLGVISRFVLRRSDAVVALGETMGARLESSGAKNVTVVHNWADGDAIRPRPMENHPLRSEWDWGDRFVVLYSGNMGMAHEFDTALSAAEKLAEHEEIRFAFIGDGPRRREVEDEALRRGLNNVEFRPYVERARLGESLTSADVHLVTLRARMPGLLVPSKIYGILAAGRPTLYVGPDEGEIADILRRGDCGCRVPIGGVDALCRAILEYCRNDRLRDAEGERARRLFDERYTREHGLRAFHELIEAA